MNLSNPILNFQTNRTDAEDIFSLETRLAVSHRASDELRDARTNYNKYTVERLHEMMPHLGWHRILEVLGIRNETIIMAQPDYYLLLDELIVSQPLNVWKNKIRYAILDQMSVYLSKDYVQARFQMFNSLIRGQEEDKVRWMKLIEEINRNLGDLLGQLFVSRYFTVQSKTRTIDLIQNLISAYRERIQRIDWLTDSTKARALTKLEKINIKIGYPSTWKSYDDVFIDRSSYFQSIISIFQSAYRKKIKDLGKPVDRDEWLITPQTVNAFYVTKNLFIV